MPLFIKEERKLDRWQLNTKVVGARFVDITGTQMLWSFTTIMALRKILTFQRRVTREVG
ncbi:MAG: hypothetical protein NC828_05325 [Candidatus Omnitrophica bacterium]|nr:hypothetical protein [Candidatus Omnitrophota bacterium]